MISTIRMISASTVDAQHTVRQSYANCKVPSCWTTQTKAYLEHSRIITPRTPKRIAIAFSCFFRPFCQLFVLFLCNSGEAPQPAYLQPRRLLSSGETTLPSDDQVTTMDCGIEDLNICRLAKAKGFIDSQHTEIHRAYRVAGSLSASLYFQDKAELASMSEESTQKEYRSTYVYIMNVSSYCHTATIWGKHGWAKGHDMPTRRIPMS